MQTPDQNPDSREGNESLQSIIRILKETAAKFSSLDEDAKQALKQKDTSTYSRKLAGKAQLLIDLPGLLTGIIDNLEPEEKHKIMLRINWYATSAREALQQGLFELNVLLIPKGNEVGDKNDLEKFISILEKK